MNSNNRGNIKVVQHRTSHGVMNWPSAATASWTLSGRSLSTARPVHNGIGYNGVLSSTKRLFGPADFVSCEQRIRYKNTPVPTEEIEWDFSLRCGPVSRYGVHSTYIPWGGTWSDSGDSGDRRFGRLRFPTNLRKRICKAPRLRMADLRYRPQTSLIGQSQRSPTHFYFSSSLILIRAPIAETLQEPPSFCYFALFLS